MKRFYLNSVFLFSFFFGASLEIDYEEYSTDVLARSAYINSSGVDDSYTKLLLHCDGANGGVVFVDESGKTIIANGNTNTSTTQKKFGITAAYFDGSGDNLETTANDSTDFKFGTVDMTIDFWIYWSVTAANVSPFASKSYNGSAGDYRIYLTNDANKYWAVALWDASYANVGFASTTTPSVNTWYHVALVHSGSNLRLYINGASVGFSTTSTSIGSITDFDHVSGVAIGGSAKTFNGYIDEVRASGVARWTADFSASLPSVPYSGDIVVWTDGVFKTQGSYSLKFASQTTALNKTLVKVFTVNHNLTSVNNLIFDVMASRTGSNFKLGLHDVGGTTTELTPSIITAGNVWQRVNWSLAGVTDANKDAIDSLKITVLNADAVDTVRIDNFMIGTCVDVIGEVQ